MDILFSYTYYTYILVLNSTRMTESVLFTRTISIYTVIYTCDLPFLFFCLCIVYFIKFSNSLCSINNEFISKTTKCEGCCYEVNHTVRMDK